MHKIFSLGLAAKAKPAALVAAAGMAHQVSESDVAAGIVILILIATLVALALSALTIVSLWKVFKKAGMPGWASIVPFYNTVKELEMVQKPYWWSIMIVIPFVNFFFAIILTRRLAAVFGKGAWFTVGLLFLPFIFFPILAFGDSVYTRPVEPARPMSNAVQWSLISMGAFFFIMLLITSGNASSNRSQLSIISQDASTSGTFATDGVNVYYNDSVMYGADPDSFKILGRYYEKDNNAVYAGEQPLPNANPHTFHVLADDMYAEDGVHVYFMGDTVTGADPNSIQVADPIGSGYALDAQHVYYGKDEIPNADTTSFSVFSDGYYAKDANTVYYNGVQIPGADAATFKSLWSDDPNVSISEAYDAYDKNHHYMNGEIVK